MTSLSGVELKKDATYTVVSPAVPAVPAVPAIAFRMYATPPPLGYTYRQLSGARPNDLASFLSWSQLMIAPEQYTSVAAGYEYKTLAQLSGQAIPPGSSAVYETIGGVLQLVGYTVPIFRSEPLPPQYWGPIVNMEFVHFLDAPAYASNGYPLGPGPYTGEFFVPTVAGLQRVERQYVKDGRGVWMPTTTVNPPYCRTEGSCRVTALIGFPGRAAVPGAAEVRTRDQNFGWNSGANSIAALNGDIRLRFPSNIAVAGAVGWANARDSVTEIGTLSHAFYFDQSPETGQVGVSIIEHGFLRFQAGTATDGAEYEIKRVDGIVSYLIDAVVVYASGIPSGGALRVGAALYAADDAVGDGLVFEHVSGGATTTALPAAAGRGTINFVGLATGPTLSELGAVGRGTITLCHAQGIPVSDVVQISVGYGEISIVGGYSFGPGVYPPAEGDSAIQITGRAYEAADVGYGTISLIGFALGGDAPVQTAFDDTIAIGSAVAVNTSATAQQTLLLRSAMAAMSSTGTQIEAGERIADLLRAGAAQAIVFRELLAVGISAGVSVADTYLAISRAADGLLLADIATNEVEATEVVLSALAMLDEAFALLVNTLDDTVSIEGTMRAAAETINRLVDAAVVGLDSTEAATIGIVLGDHVALADDALTAAEVVNVLADRAMFGLRFTIDSGEYVAWVMNTESKGLTRYVNYPFNSFMKVGGRYYGATDNGIYSLDGANDAGDDIDLAMRFGLNAYGTQAYKRMPTFYVAFRTDGDILLKAVVADATDGERTAHCYRLKSTRAQNMREGRRPIGRGLSAIYWDFVIENIDGADLEIDVVEMMPLVLSRRIRGDSEGPA